MPCYDERSSPSYIAAEYREKVDNLTQILCAVLTQWEANGKPFVISSQTQLWWEKHQEWDRRRLRDEQEAQTRREAKRQALRKLTKKERRLLGVRDEQ